MNRVTVTFFILVISSGCAPKWDILSPKDRGLVEQIRAHWETWVPAKKKEGKLPLVTFEELFSGLEPDEKQLLDRILSINPQKSFGFQGGYLGGVLSGVQSKRLEDQWVMKQGKRELLDPQYLPEHVYEAYERMMAAMQADIGKRLLVESGYRSQACQLYTFLFYLPKHRYSLVETGHWVALPGYSEHGAPHKQAIDFINEEGINGEDNPEEFERLPEYVWLKTHAKEYGFELSYPRGKKGITFEPWHWRYKS